MELFRYQIRHFSLVKFSVFGIVDFNRPFFVAVSLFNSFHSNRKYLSRKIFQLFGGVVSYTVIVVQFHMLAISMREWFKRKQGKLHENVKINAYLQVKHPIYRNTVRKFLNYWINYVVRECNYTFNIIFCHIAAFYFYSIHSCMTLKNMIFRCLKNSVCEQYQNVFWS